MKSYFFVPANRLHKVSTIEAYGVDNLIIDLEDSIKQSEISEFIVNLIAEETYKKYFIRLHILNDKHEIDLEVFHQLAKNGYQYFIIPKLQNYNQAKTFFTLVQRYNFQFIILVESPRFFIQLDAILEEFSSQICGVGIGSHDLLGLIGAKHTMSNLEFIRQSILYMAKAHEKETIDFASMNLKDQKAFSNELTDAFDKGFDAKFFIHPWQINCLNRLDFYNDEDYAWAKRIYKALEKVNFNDKEFNALKIDGEIVEKPHINRAKRIIEYFKK
ncbi:HpcH/HpaI aldolase/citrate lyase family protein [Psychroserpens sp. S379A]|uniref:HpcH/HpaI aldolase/citrate lyase family protein n=1 Tax=Psychroserpens sp. S379A TaxID=3415137 RepID=UPI003C7EA3EA